jgi:diaminopimelate epimerase
MLANKREYMDFIKMQGAGNDFVMLKPEIVDLEWSQLAQSMCNRRFGIGADGLILALPSKIADLRMRIFNPDGSEAETCGNGLRCLGKYAVINKLVNPGARQISIETIPGVRKIKLGYNRSEISQIQVGIGVPRFSVRDIPLRVESGKSKKFDMNPILDYPLIVDDTSLSLSFVSMGNPHAVHFIANEISEFPLSELGPQVENHPLFPKRINFEIARVMNRQKIEVRVWERGAGETLACGTGACAVAVAAHLHDYIDDKVDIILPGGTLNIEWDGRGEVLMSGPAEVVFRGEWPQ